MGEEQQRLVQMLVERTGQPREKVEAWVAGMVTMLQGSFTVYDVSRMVGGFIAKHAREAKPFFLRFSRSLLESFVEEQRRLQEQEREQMAIKKTIPRVARSTEGTEKNYKPPRKQSRYRLRDNRNDTEEPVSYQPRLSALRTRHRAVKPSQPNPWAPVSVLLHQPIYISSYSARRDR